MEVLGVLGMFDEVGRILTQLSLLADELPEVHPVAYLKATSGNLEMLQEDCRISAISNTLRDDDAVIRHIILPDPTSRR